MAFSLRFIIEKYGIDPHGCRLKPVAVDIERSCAFA